MMDTMKLVGSLVTALVVSFSSINKDNSAVTGPAVDHEPDSMLVSEWPTVDDALELSSDPTADIAELRDLAKQLEADSDDAQAAAAKQRANAEGFKTFKPKKDTPSSSSGLTEARVKDLLLANNDILVARLRSAMNASSNSNGSSGGSVATTSTGVVKRSMSGGGTSSGLNTPPGWMTPGPLPGFQASTSYYPNAVPVPVPDPVPMVIPPAASQPRTVSFYRDYQASNGCTVRETTYSDGTTSSRTISCPMQQKKTLRQRFRDR